MLILFTNADCTLYHRELDPKTRRDMWTKLQISGVYWESITALSEVGVDKGVLKANELLLCIPNPPENLTITVGDIVAKGILTEEIGTDITSAQLIRLYKNDAFTVTSVQDCRYGSEKMHHIEVKGA